MKKILYITSLIIALVLNPVNLAHAKKYDATLSFIIQNPGKNDVRLITREFGKNFSEVLAFQARQKTNYFLHYNLTDENNVQIDVGKRDLVHLVGINLRQKKIDHAGFGTRMDVIRRKVNKEVVQYGSGARDYEVNIEEKPFKGTMVLYNGYGTELIKVESQDHYKTESAALKNTIKQMRRAIDRQKDKMAINQKSRCLFCDYGDLKVRQKEKVDELAYISHREQINQLYGETFKIELPNGLVPYANIYSSIKDYKTLEVIIDTDAIIFDNQLGTKKLPGHLINEVIMAGAPEELIRKIAATYLKSNFQELDINNLTPFWSAIAQQDSELMERLIGLGVNVNQVTNVDGNYLTPLILSAQYGSQETTKILLSKGAKKQLVTPSGVTAWSTAMWLAKYDQAELLWPSDFIDYSSMEAQNYLIQAAYYGQLEKVNELIRNLVPVTSRGMNGDNIAIAAIKGINTFAIEADMELPGAALHKAGTETYWDIIEGVEKAGLESPIISTQDTIRQTLLFHAYPDGSSTVKDDHMKIISRIINEGIDPNILNIKGQNSEQVYMDARMAYLDELYKSRLAEINNEREAAANQAQEKQDISLSQLTEAINSKDTFKRSSRAMSRAKREYVMERKEIINMKSGLYGPTFSQFELAAADIENDVGSEKAIKDLDKKIREEYANDLHIANEVANRKNEQLENQISQLKKAELEKAESRKIIINKVLEEVSF